MRGPGAGPGTAAWRFRPARGPTSPEAEIAPGAVRVAVIATAMPKGPKQQLPEPEWIGDGDTTSPAGEACGQGGTERGREERRVWVC